MSDYLIWLIVALLILGVTKVNEDGSAKVNYRGTSWTAYADNGSLECGVYKIERVEGTRLILKK